MYSVVVVPYAENFFIYLLGGGDLTILVFHNLESPLFSDLMIYSPLQTVFCLFCFVLLFPVALGVR